jgi:protein-tyrosine-phosphatase
MPAVLFVCTANMCRSPMAEALFRHRLRQAELGEDWRVESAGTWARDGDHAASGSIHAMGEVGLDISSHRSRAITYDLLCQYDLILVMSKGHQEALRVEFPDLAGRIHLLTAMAGPAYDVPDPIGGPLSGYREIAREIDGLLARGFKRIVQTATDNASQRHS